MTDPVFNVTLTPETYTIKQMKDIEVILDEKPGLKERYIAAFKNEFEDMQRNGLIVLDRDKVELLYAYLIDYPNQSEIGLLGFIKKCLLNEDEGGEK